LGASAVLEQERAQLGIAGADLFIASLILDDRGGVRACKHRENQTSKSSPDRFLQGGKVGEYGAGCGRAGEQLALPADTCGMDISDRAWMNDAARKVGANFSPPR